MKVATKKVINIKSPITDGWFVRFKAKIRQVTLCRGDRDANVCANCSNREMTYRNYFELLKHDLTDKPVIVTRQSYHLTPVLSVL